MSVATEFPPAVVVPERARQLPRPAAPARPAERPRLRLVPPVQRCAPSGSRLDGARHGAVRAARPSVRLVTSARPAARLSTAGAERLSSATLRLTRRGVVAIALGVAAVGGLLLLVAHLSASSPTAAAVLPPGGVVTVQPGDTLWSIAGQVAPDRDPRGVVERIRESNHLTSVSLIPGQTLKVG
ncbi:MAG: LysM peptidoglycan-binding domain-containing protein [Jatrophihabitantaceae bacterium]